MLHHLQRRVEQAIQEYEALIEEWTQDPEAQEDPETQVDLAIVKRNYSEALRAEAPRSPDPATQLQRARDALDEAHELVAKQRRPDEIPVFSEILYEKARLAEAEGKLDEALELLNQAHGAARKSGHRMLEAIAASRKHWLLIDHQGQPFDLEAWREHVDDLACFPDHGWAVRKLIDGRTRTARVLADSGQTAAALEWLQANLEDFARNPSFDEGSDRRRIAVTYAGLAHLGDGGDAVWADFRSRYGWADGWLDHHEVSAPSDTWERHADG